MKKSIFDCLKSTLNDIKNIIFQPTKFFKSVKNEKNNTRFLNVFLVSTIIYLILDMIISSWDISAIFIPIAIIGELILVFVFTYILAFITNIFLKLFSTKNTTSNKTVSILFYSSALTFLLVIPIIDIIASIYSIVYLVPKGLSIKYKISNNKALLSSVLSVLIFYILFFIIIFFALGLEGFGYRYI